MRLLVAIMQSHNKCSLLKYDKKRLGCDNPVLFIITQAGQIKYTYLNKVAKLNATKYTVNQPNTNISMQRESAMFLIFRLKVLTTPDSVVLNSRHIHLFPYFEIRRVYASMVVLGSRGVTCSPSNVYAGSNATRSQFSITFKYVDKLCCILTFGQVLKSALTNRLTLSFLKCRH